MAKVLSPDEVSFGRGRAGDSWVQDEWFDGQSWMLEGGVDFSIKPDTAKSRLYAEASKKGLSARAKTVNDGDVIFQAYERDAEHAERVAAATAKRVATRAANKAAKEAEAA